MPNKQLHTSQENINPGSILSQLKNNQEKDSHEIRKVMHLLSAYSTQAQTELAPSFKTLTTA